MEEYSLPFSFSRAFAVLGTVALLWVLTSCFQESPVDPAHEPDLETVSAATTCAAGLTHYPVNGPHNGGWDSNALTYTCHPHPDSSPDNSDWISGSHYGNDIFAARGTPVVASQSGRISTGYGSVGGNWVTITDDCGWHYYNAHLDAVAAGISNGVEVSGGQLIGTVGNTGNAVGTSPHVHYSIYPEAYESGINPFSLLETVDEHACDDHEVDEQCAGRESSRFCASNAVLGICSDGDYAESDCGSSGGTCSDVGGTSHCVDALCNGREGERFCRSDTTLGVCDGGSYSDIDCADSGCSSTGDEAQCVDWRCVGAENRRWCPSNSVAARCADGVYDEEICAVAEECRATEESAGCVDIRCELDETTPWCISNEIVAFCDGGDTVEYDCGDHGGVCLQDGEDAYCADLVCLPSESWRWCEGDTLHSCITGHIRSFDCIDDGRVCREGSCVTSGDTPEPPDGGTGSDGGSGGQQDSPPTNGGGRSTDGFADDSPSGTPRAIGECGCRVSATTRGDFAFLFAVIGLAVTRRRRE